MYGKFPFGATMSNTTVLASVELMPLGSRTPANADRAAPLFAGSHCAFSDATTSSAVSGVVPSLNMTPCRILNVHCEASAFGVQLSASTGESLRFASDHVR